jgi:hypothetical protein
MKMDNRKKIVAGILTLIFFYSCEEITEVNLTTAPVIITAPVDSLQTSTALNTFVWENVKGAVRYQFQIASPKFDSVVRFVVDSSLTGNIFTYSLSPGKYQWRVRGLNTSTHTAYFVRTITIQ